MESKSYWFFDKINMIDKPLAQLTQRKKERPKLTEIGMNRKILPQTPNKFRTFQGNTLKRYTICLETKLSYQVVKPKRNGLNSYSQSNH